MCSAKPHFNKINLSLLLASIRFDKMFIVDYLFMKEILSGKIAIVSLQQLRKIEPTRPDSC